MTQNPELSVVGRIEAMPELPVVAWRFHGVPPNGPHSCTPKLGFSPPDETWPVRESLCKVSDALTYASQTLASRDGEIARLREALNALVDRNFTFFSGTMVGADKAIRQKEVQAARAALAPQPTKEQSNG